MKELNTALAVVGAMIILLGLLSKPIRNRSPFSFPLIAFLVGVALGPTGAGLLDPGRWGDKYRILEEMARLTLAIGLMAVALRIPPGLFLDQRRPLAVLLGLVMPGMWVAGSLMAWLLLDLPPAVAFLAGGIITPTDPVVASSIVTAQVAKENVPGRVRHVLSGESGANDGLAYLFVLLPVLMITRSSPAAAAEHWLLHTMLREVGGAILLGILLGWLAGRLLTWAENRDYIEGSSFLAYTIALALLALGAGKRLGTDGILAVFVTGVVFDNMVGARDRAEEENIQEAVNQFFSVPIFTLLGLMIPVGQWKGLGWAGVAFAVSVLAFRRLPVLLSVRPWMGSLRPLRDAFFLGWFGPIGVSAIFYAMLALRKTGDDRVWAIASLVICASVIAHGVTASPLTRRYGRSGTEQSPPREQSGPR